MAGGGELGPDLMGPAGNQVALHQGQTVFLGQRPVDRHRRFGPRLRLAPDVDLFFHLVLEKIPLQLPLRGGHAAPDRAEVKFAQLPVLNLLVHHPQALGSFGGDDDAPGVPVDAVAKRGGKGVLPVGGPLLFLVQIGLDVGEEGVYTLALVGVNHQARTLIQQQDVFVLIEDIQPGLVERQKGVLQGGFVKKLVVDIQLHHVAPVQAHIPLAPLAVHLHPLQPDVLLR